MEHLIPDAPFDAMPQLMLLVVTAGVIFVLVKGADWLVDGAAGLARRMGIAKVIVGATIVSLGTTSPEAAVSVMAAWQGKAGLALGNAVGSIIADTGLIFGLGCVLAVLPADRFVLKRQGWVKIGSCALLAVLCFGLFTVDRDQAVLGRSVGILLLALLIGYLFVSVRWSRQHLQGEPYLDAENDGSQREQPQSTVALSLLIVGGLLLVVVSSQFVVGSVTVMAQRWGVPEVVIASTLVAFGTSLPELVVGMTSIIKGQGELLVGNIIGADILNVLFVVGASAVAAPLPIIDQAAQNPRIFLYLHLPTMMIMIGLFLVYIFAAVKKEHFQKWYGYPLLLLYVAFLAIGWLLEAGGN